MDATVLLIALLTLVAGAAVGWLAARARVGATAAERVRVAEAGAGEALRAAQAQAAEQLRAVERSAVEQVRAAERQAHDARAESAALRATLDAERERAATQADTEERLREAFGALAGSALQRNNEAFAALADAKLSAARAQSEGDLARRQQAIEGLVAPVRESLERVQHQLTSVEKDRAGSYAQLVEQVTTMRSTSEQLRVETAQLVTALRAPQVRGRWGEMQLRRAVEAAGMTEHIDFVEQESVTGADGRLRPDLVVRLVGGKNVVVDSKVAFAGYLEAMEAKDETVREARLKAHARHLRTHIDQLGAKAYHEHFAPSPEFVVCFVPADAFLDAALQVDPTLQERAFDQNVVLATPSTLVALLRTVAYTWRQEALAENAAEVHRLGRELYQRLSTIGGHLDKLGRALNTSVGTYNQTIASLESRVFVTARKMADLKVVDPSDALETPAQVTEHARSTQAPELTEQRVVALPKHRGVPAGQTELPTAPETGARTGSEVG